VGQGTIAEILSVVGLGGPRIAHAKMWTPSLRFLNNWGKTFLGLGRPGVAVARILGLAQNWLGGITRGPREVQNKIGSELLTQSILAQ